MPSFDLDENSAAYQIRGYQPGALLVNDETITTSIIITPNELMKDWKPQRIDELTRESLDVIISLKPDILLLGTGETLIFPDIALYGHLINHGIGVEIMNTAAACRTYNALSAEARRVAAALFIR
jgi:uncharacterized protein